MSLAVSLKRLSNSFAKCLSLWKGFCKMQLEVGGTKSAEGIKVYYILRD